MALLTRLRAILALLLSNSLPVKIGASSGHYYPASGLVLPTIAGADGEGEGGDDADEADDEKAGGDKEDGGDSDDEADEDKVDKDDDWKTKSRKNENRAKREKAKREELEAELRKRKDADKTEQEKALDKAREEAKAEALSEAEKERRSDRLEVAVTRLASKGLTVGDGDDAETKRFADTDDALLNIERAIAKDEIDEGDIFDDQGKVDTDALKSELADLLRRKPHLAAGGTERTDPGDNDAGKGGAAKSNLEEMSPEDHARRKYGDKK